MGGLKHQHWVPEEDIEQVLFSEADIRRRVIELGAEITRDYHGRPLVLLGVLKGAVVFLADLLREIRLPAEVDFIAISSYGASTQSSGIIRFLKDLESPVEGKDILVVEDIVDTGLTLRYILDSLSTRHPSTVRVCGLLLKERERMKDVSVDYVGFRIPDRFVVGYGLDYAERYRNLPYLGILRASVYENHEAT